MRFTISLSVIAVIHLAIQAASLAADPTEPAPPKVKVTIGKETTYITKPLRPDGYPDYVAALNEIYSRGVTPENNAAVLLQTAFGPEDIEPQLRSKFFKQLGMEVLPETGDYFVTEFEMMRRWQADRPEGEKEANQEKWESQIDQASQRPWTSTEFPLVAQWLQVNEKSLSLVLQASGREKRYYPVLIKHDSPLIGCLLPHDQKLRSVVIALEARAMLAAGNGNVAAAWQQLLACHRLARLTTQGFFIIDVLVGYAIEDIAVRGDIALVHTSSLTVRDLSRMRADLKALSPFSNPAQVIDIGERLVTLDATVHIAREGARSLDALITTDHRSQSNALQEFVLNDAWVDWDVSMRSLNEWYDRVLTIVKIDDPKLRRDAIRKFDVSLHDLAERIKSPRLLLWDFLSKNTATEVVSPRVAGILVVLLLPALQAVRNAEERIKIVEQMDDTAFALAQYRADHGSYPENLGALVPTYLGRLPVDTFTDNSNPICYRREENAYVLWTVHINGINEDGRTSEDDPSGDDYAIRPVPREAKAK